MGVRLALLGALLLAGCAKSLEQLAPFPCAIDGSCPSGFACEMVAGFGSVKQCVAVDGGGITGSTGRTVGSSGTTGHPSTTSSSTTTGSTGHTTGVGTTTGTSLGTSGTAGTSSGACATCTQLLSGSANPPCPGSDQRFTALEGCACANCSACTGACQGTGITNSCASCASSACSSQLSACARDQGTSGGTAGTTGTNGCGPMNCGGCCDSQGTCQTAPNASACGRGGEVCFSCSAGSQCVGGTCQASGTTGGGQPICGPCASGVDCASGFCDAATGRCSTPYKCSANPSGCAPYGCGADGNCACSGGTSGTSSGLTCPTPPGSTENQLGAPCTGAASGPPYTQGSCNPDEICIYIYDQPRCAVLCGYDFSRCPAGTSQCLSFSVGAGTETLAVCGVTCNWTLPNSCPANFACAPNSPDPSWPGVCISTCSAGTCPGSEVCNNGLCKCAQNSDCNGLTCDPGSGACYAPCSASCASPNCCDPGNPGAQACLAQPGGKPLCQPCASGADCASLNCVNGQCAPYDSCATNSECSLMGFGCNADAGTCICQGG